jgi:hypothetical protein
MNADGRSSAMKNMFRLIVLLLLVGGWTVAAAALHIVRAEDKRVIVIPKQKLSFSDTFLDTRKWTMDDVATHPTVVNRLIQNGKADALQHVAPQAQGDDLTNELKNAITRGPAVKPAETTKPVSAPGSSV